MPIIPRYFDLLVLLVERRQSAVHRRDIFELVWTDVIVSDSALSQAVRTLRRTLGDDSREPRFIRTVARHGYSFVYRGCHRRGRRRRVAGAGAGIAAAAGRAGAGRCLRTAAGSSHQCRRHRGRSPRSGGAAACAGNVGGAEPARHSFRSCRRPRPPARCAMECARRRRGAGDRRAGAACGRARSAPAPDAPGRANCCESMGGRGSRRQAWRASRPALPEGCSSPPRRGAWRRLPSRRCSR